jgi:hypothetical protein
MANGTANGSGAPASGWTIHSFDRVQWDALFGSQSADAAQHIVDAVLWDEVGYFAADGINPGTKRAEIVATEAGDRVLDLAGHLAWHGFTYNGLDAGGQQLLDQLGAFLWADEALGGQLDVTGHSPDYVGLPTVEELLYRAGNVNRMPVPQSLFRPKPGLFGKPKPVPHAPARLLPFLLHGRRVGSDDYPQDATSMYAVFSPVEVSELFYEVKAAVDTRIAWRNPHIEPEQVTSVLLEPLSDVADSRRWMAISCAW